MTKQDLLSQTVAEANVKKYKINYHLKLRRSVHAVCLLRTVNHSASHQTAT